MIKSIELTNWKTHRHTVINFQKGVNVLIGVMGAGKSSVIDGISFGLFGTFPSLNHKRTTTENLISNRPDMQDHAEVKINFTVDSDEYSVTRRISRSETASAKIEKNGSYLQAQPARVNEEISELIKIDYDTFSRAIYAEQNRLDYFLELPKGERKRQIDQMLGLDSFAKAEENATSLINSIKSVIGEEEQILAQSDDKAMKEQLEGLTNERQQIEKEQRELAAQAKEKESTVKGLEKELSEIKSRYERSKRLEKEIAELSSRIDTLQKELKKIESTGIDRGSIDADLKSHKKKLDEIESGMKELKKTEADALRGAADAEAALALNSKKASERDMLLESLKGKDLEALERSQKDMENSANALVKEHASLKGRRDDTKKWAMELSEHISKCPVCERELDDKTKGMLLEQKNSAISKIEDEIAKIEKGIAKSEAEIKESRKELERVRIATTRMTEYKDVDKIIEKSSAQSKELRQAHSKLTVQIDALAKDKDALNKVLGELSIKLDALKRKEKYEMEINDSNEQLGRKNTEIKDVKFDEKELYKLQELITKESSLLGQMVEKTKSNERHSKSLDSQIEDKAKSIASLNMIRERIENRRGHISSMTKFRSALVETEAQLRNSLVTSINSLMQNVWVELYPYADYSAIRLNAMKDDYSLEACTAIDEEGKRTWVDIDGIASGGERSVACLTMRIALAMVIVPNLRWLILDEPTHNIDENGINRFIEVLGGTLPKVVEQVFIITHDNALKNISSAKVYSLERDKNKNEYTSVVET